MKKFVGVLLAVLFVAGCGAPRYAPPGSGPTATVKYITPKNLVDAALFTYENENCENIKYMSPLSISGFTHGVEETPGIVTTTLQVPAGDRFINHFRILSFGIGGRECQLTVSFVPQPNETYVEQFGLQYRECSANIFHVDAATGKLSPEASAQKNKKQCPY